ncbi:MAG: porin family protein [Planctomycetes bacterium]|nr:porin family protein [Planctomycetota bacterium]
MRAIHRVSFLLALAPLPFAGCVSDADARRSMPPAEASASTPTRTRAAEEPRPVQQASPTHHSKSGPLEFSLGGAGISNDRVDAGSGQATGAIGYYLNDSIEVLFRQNGAMSDPGEGFSDVWTGASRVAIDFHLPLGNVVPYVGANLGYVYGNGVRDSLMGGPEAGVKFYVKPDVFVLLSGEYQFYFDRSDTIDTAFDDGQILYGLSLGVRF